MKSSQSINIQDKLEEILKINKLISELTFNLSHPFTEPFAHRINQYGLNYNKLKDIFLDASMKYKQVLRSIIYDLDKSSYDTKNLISIYDSVVAINNSLNQSNDCIYTVEINYCSRLSKVIGYDVYEKLQKPLIESSNLYKSEANLILSDLQSKLNDLLSSKIEVKEVQVDKLKELSELTEGNFENGTAIWKEDITMHVKSSINNSLDILIFDSKHDSKLEIKNVPSIYLYAGLYNLIRKVKTSKSLEMLKLLIKSYGSTELDKYITNYIK